ncbi:MAG: nucleoside transporter C-terminal domain-containing protein [Saprospiraceae bacterium]|nr:Na+ dependent nucleoside transporter [Saprospiraceae bacterium]MDW8228711.1 nucleoside transporter C-terminal domain-containing protein [Saprospiraceae bacterium]
MEMLINIGRGLLGMGALLAIAYLLSQNRRAINWQLVGAGITLQLVFAILILKVPGVSWVFDEFAKIFTYVIQWSEKGAEFIFGDLATGKNGYGYIFAFRVLPTVMFYSALSAILFYFGILQKIVYGIAWVLTRSMGLSGPESLAAAANVFIGQTEAPLIIRPYLAEMSRSEIMCLMTGGMATIAGGVFAAYVGFLGGEDPAQQLLFARHLLAASIMSAPAAVVCAKMLQPETEKQALEKLTHVDTHVGDNLLDAIAKGTTDGLKLAVNVGAMLIVFTALVFMLNWILENTLGHWTGVNEAIAHHTNGRFSGLTFTYLLGLFFAPVAWLLGTPWADCMIVGQLLGLKTMINEFVGYSTLGEVQKTIALQPKSVIIAVYALCGFSNFASIGIQIGGIGTLAPNQRSTLTELGYWSLIGGTLACFMTAAIAGMLF